jgi:hypothetical protein
MKISKYLRLRPLEQKHKLKEDYFTLIGNGRNTKEEKKDSEKPKSVIHDPLKRSKD